MFELLRLSGCDFGLARDVEIGDRVRHRGTKQWGSVLEVVPQSDGTAELRVKRDLPRFEGDFVGEGWWATYHCDRREKKSSFGASMAEG